jgi:hypothetical protein
MLRIPTRRLHAFLFPVLLLCAVAARFAYAGTAPSGSMHGKAVDADGIGVEGVDISVYGTDTDHPIATAVTGADGSFSISNVTPGDSLSVKAFHKGHPFDQNAEKTGVAVAADHPTDVGSLELKIIMHHHKKPATTAAATQP